jgi:hypothetical protein
MKPYAGISSSVTDIFFNLLDRLTNQGHRLFMDNFYNSVELTKKLLEVNTHVCGTIRSYRGEPESIRQLKNSTIKKKSCSKV